MDPFKTVALSWNEDEAGAVKLMLSFVAVKLYDPLLTRVANVPVTFPFVDCNVAFAQ